jgi:ATP-binding cassette subfamily C protein LapB
MNVNDLPQQPSTLGGNAEPLRSDPLLEAILCVCRHYGVSRTPLSLIDGLPYDGALTPEVGMRALEQAGFSVRLVERDPREIFDALLPVILLRSEGRALVLMERESGVSIGAPQAGGPRFRVGAADPTGRELVLTESELLADYTGFCMLIKLQPKMENRTELKDPEPPSRWLWSTVWKYRRYYRDALIASVLINLLTTWIGLFSIHVYDRVIPTEAYSTLWSLATGVFIGLFFLIAASQIRTYFLDLAGRKADIALASILFRRAMGLRMEYAPRSAGTFAHQLRAFESVREFGTSASMSVITDIPFIFLFLYMTWVVAGPLVLIPVVVTVTILTAGLIIQMPLNRLMR